VDLSPEITNRLWQALREKGCVTPKPNAEG
jgi:hypothetical protein